MGGATWDRVHPGFEDDMWPNLWGKKNKHALEVYSCFMVQGRPCYGESCHVHAGALGIVF